MSNYLKAIHRVNEQATENRGWFSQVEHQVDRHGVTTALITTFLKPYFNNEGKPAWNKSDGYTVQFPSKKLTYHDKRTEFMFKQNDNKLERMLLAYIDNSNLSDIKNI